MSYNKINEPLVKYMSAANDNHDLSLKKATSSYDNLFQDTLLMNEISEAGIPYSVFQQMQEAGPLSLQEWADIMGLSSKTLTRYRQENKVFQPWHSSIILQVSELLSLGMDIFGEKDKLYRWLGRETFALGGRSPISFLTNAYGRDLVTRELYNIEHGIFA